MAGMKPFEIFRTGTLTSSQGKTITFSDGDLATIASSYNPSLHQAPIVVGHPKTNMPAFGWVKGLTVKGDRLVAEPDRLDRDLEARRDLPPGAQDRARVVSVGGAAAGRLFRGLARRAHL